MKKVISPIDIEGIYRDYLDEKQELNRKERYEGNKHWYHASGAGSCSRKLYFESVEMIEPTNSIDDRTKRLLSLGNLVHEDIQNSLTRTRNNRDILKGLNITIKPGELHAIMGPNGSGKSTLANILSGKKGYEIDGYDKKRNLFPNSYR